MRKEMTATNWGVGLAQAGPIAAQDRADETERVARALREALVNDDREKLLAQFDRAVVLYSLERRWHDGLAAAREVYDAVAAWPETDATPYANTVAQFAHNYAIELQQARLFEAAEELYRQAMQFFEASGDAPRQMVTAHQLGRLHQDRCDHAQAEQAYRASLEIARILSDLPRTAKNLFQLGQLAQLGGDTMKAADLYAEVLPLAEQIHDERLVAATEHQLGILAQNAGDNKEARRLFESALSRAEDCGDTGTKADALHQLGMIAHEHGDYFQAEELYRASLAAAHGANQPAGAGPTLYQLAQASLAQGDFAAALDYAHQSLAIFQAQGDLAAIRRLRGLANYLEFKQACYL